MKRFIIEFLLALTLLSPAALAQEAPLENLTIEDGWMWGTVTAISNGRECEIKVDCPVPEAAYPDEVLTVGNRYFSKQDMQRALKAAGQSAEGQFQNHRDYTRYTGNWNAEASADITWDDALIQATQIGLAYFDALGVEVERTPRRTDRPYDYDYYMEKHLTLFSHAFSDITYQLNYLTPQWKRTHRYDPAQKAYTKVEFTVMLEGKRLWPQPSYPAGYADEPDAWIGSSVSAYVIVSDSGILVEAGTSHIPEIKKRRPLLEGELDDYSILLNDRAPLIAAADWQSALIKALDGRCGVSVISLGSEEQTYQNQYMEKPGTIYRSQGVITQISPCLFTLSENEWAPFWFIESVEEYEDGWRSESFW